MYPLEPDYASYLVLGKYQYSRQRLTQLQGIELENLLPISNEQVTNKYPDVFVLSSLDCKSGGFESTYRDTEGGEAYAKYLLCKVGVNHCIMIKGNFVLNSLVIVLNNHGGR